MGAIRKQRFSNGDVDKAMDGFFNKLLGVSFSHAIHFPGQDK